MLVPTRELASQVTKVIARYSTFCARDIRAVDLTSQATDQGQRALLSSNPNIVVATPARASTHLSASTLNVDGLVHLVIDEADLVLSYEYGQDFENIVKLIPRGVQTFLASASLNPDVSTLQGLFCRDPVIVDLKEEEKVSTEVVQHVVRCGEDEKFLFTYALFKLKLVQGKAIIFVADVDRCYRLKLFLEQFGVKSCVLNSELPVNCRVRVVEEFNKNVYDIIIATDEHEMDASDAVNTDTKLRKPKRSKTKDDYGISRGIDFQAVSLVLNFDLPASPTSYLHRIGRTARANHTGHAFSFYVPRALYRHPNTNRLSHPSTAHDESHLEGIQKSQEDLGRTITPFTFDAAKLKAFEYRVASALKAVTPGGIREARITELRRELLKSEKLKRHLEENPDDLKWLRHDSELKPARVQPHLRHVPDYLLPGGKLEAKRAEFVGMKVDRTRNRRKGRGVRKANPLKTFNAKR